MSPIRSSYSKTSSRANVPSGLHPAVVTQVNGDKVFVKIPRLTYEFEYGPVPYIGATPAVDEHLFVGFIEGVQDDIVGIFPGQAANAGPIEPTWVMAAVNATSELQQVADFLCDGTEDESEFHEAFERILDSGIQKGRLALSDGTFSFAGKLVVPDGLDLVIDGPSQHGPDLVWDDIGVSGNGLFEIGVGSKMEINRLKLTATVLNAAMPNYLVYKDAGGTLTMNEVTLDASLTGGGSGTVPDLIYSAANVTDFQRIIADGETGGVTIDGGTYHITNSEISADDDVCSITAQASVGWVTDNYLTSLDDTCLKVETDAGTFIRRNTFWMDDYDSGAIVVHLKGRALFDENNFATFRHGFPAAGGDLRVEDTANVTIRDNSMGAGHGRIVIMDSDFVTVYKNNFNSPNINTTSIYAEGTTTPLEGLVIVENQEGAPDGGRMIEVVNARRPLIAHNAAETEADGSIWVRDCDKPTVEHNRIKTRFGDFKSISVNNSDNATIRNNQLYGVGYIDVLNSDYVYIESNALAIGEDTAQNTGIAFTGSNNARVFNNTYLPSWNDLGSEYAYGVTFDGSSDDALLYNNDFSLCGIDILDVAGTSNEIGLHHIVVGADDPLTTGVGVQPYVWDKKGQIIDVTADAGIAPIGSDIIVDVNINGASLWAAPGDRPRIVDTTGATAREQVDGVTDIVDDGDIITVDVDQVGSTIPGGELVTTVRVREIFPSSLEGWINWTYGTDTDVAVVPTGGQAGDILVLMAALGGSTTFWGAQTGWTIVHAFENGGPFGGWSLTMGCWTRAWGSEPASYTLTQSGDHIIMGLVRGVQSSPPNVGSTEFTGGFGGSGSSVNTPGTFGTTDGDIMVNWFFSPSTTISNVTATGSAGAGMTLLIPGPQASETPRGQVYVGRATGDLRGEPVAEFDYDGQFLTSGFRIRIRS